MENHRNDPIPVPNPAPLKGHDYEPLPTTSNPQSVDEPIAGSRPPGDFDPGCKPEKGEPRH
ncbi:MAG TPA: hypothetical protein VGM86_24350 [Thermoanaerobaculia bacterium]|jgi:hypothetical protein